MSFLDEAEAYVERPGRKGCVLKLIEDNEDQREAILELVDSSYSGAVVSRTLKALAMRGEITQGLGVAVIERHKAGRCQCRKYL